MTVAYGLRAVITGGTSGIDLAAAASARICAIAALNAANLANQLGIKR